MTNHPHRAKPPVSDPRPAPHTPAPWHVDPLRRDVNHGLPVVAGANGALLAELAHSGDKGLANAAFIVRAVNAHDRLVAALKGLLAIENKTWPSYVRQEFAAARAALAAAEVAK